MVPLSGEDIELEADGLEKRKGRTGKAPKAKTKPIITDPSVLHPSDNQEATHINLFMWIRVMLQQLQAEQIHRGAATKLMFESAAAGALTHQVDDCPILRTPYFILIDSTVLLTDYFAYPIYILTHHVNQTHDYSILHTQ